MNDFWPVLPTASHPLPHALSGNAESMRKGAGHLSFREIGRRLAGSFSRHPPLLDRLGSAPRSALANVTWIIVAFSG